MPKAEFVFQWWLSSYLENVLQSMFIMFNSLKIIYSKLLPLQIRRPRSTEAKDSPKVMLLIAAEGQILMQVSKSS